MFRDTYRFPVVSGDMLAVYRTRLAAWSSLICQQKRPDVMPRRLLTLRQDGGPESVGVGLVGFGVNLWADSAVDAANLAADALAATLHIPGTVAAVKAIRDPNIPFEVDDDESFTYGGKPLSHYYFSFDAVVKATAV